MRVAYVCTDPGVPVWGNKGCSIHVQAMLREFVRRGWKVDLFARRRGGTPCMDGVKVIKLPRYDSDLELADREAFLVAEDRALRLALEQRPRYDLVYERHALWSAAAMQFASDADIASVLEVNAPLIDEQQRHRQIIALDTARRQAARSIAAARILVAVSTGVAEHLENYPDSKARTIVVGNGVDSDRFAGARAAIEERWQRRIQGECPNPLVVGFSGTLRPWHGMEMLGKAFQIFHERLPASQLLIIGDGPARDQLEKHLGQRALRATTITGKVKPSQVPELLAKVDLAALPYPAQVPSSAPFYFSPLKLFEYMACGLPTVACDIGDISRVLLDRKLGCLVDAGDSQRMAEAWLRLASAPSDAIALASRAATAAIREHSWERALDRILERVGLSAEAATARSAG